MERWAELREAVEKVKLVDAHAHNIVGPDSSLPFISCFSEAQGEALSYTPHSLSFKVWTPCFQVLIRNEELLSSQIVVISYFLSVFKLLDRRLLSYVCCFIALTFRPADSEKSGGA